MNKDKITYEELFNKPEFRREEQMKEKSEAVWVVFHELDGLVDVTKFAETYLERTRKWFDRKLYGYSAPGVKDRFNESDYPEITAGLRDIANRLNAYADEIDAAEYKEWK